MFVAVDGYTTNLVITNSSAWIAFTNTFVATSSKTTVEFTGNSALSMLLDDITFAPPRPPTLKTTTCRKSHWPRLPAKILKGAGRSTFGTPALMRPPAASAVLKSWTLEMTFSSTNVHLIVLTNHVHFTGNSIPANSISYFAFDVPPGTPYVTNTLSSAPASPSLNLIFHQAALPADGSFGDYLLATNPPSPGLFVLSQTGDILPPLEPGLRYYLGLQNTGPLPQSFDLRVDTYIPPTNVLTVLSNQSPVHTNITANGSPEYFAFDVPTNAVMASFQLLNVTNGEVDLYARYGTPLPGPLGFDYESVVVGTSNEPILVSTNSSITTNSAPVPLQPGRWYLAAYNPAQQQALNYTVTASYVMAPANIVIIPLTNAISFTNIAEPGFPTNVFYSFTNKPGAAGVLFVLTNLSASGNIDLVVGFGDLPTPSEHYSGSYNFGSLPESVQIRDKLRPPGSEETMVSRGSKQHNREGEVFGGSLQFSWSDCDELSGHWTG